MTFLELCRATRAEIGYSGNGPSTVVGQIGQYGNLVRWVNDEWLAIQGKHKRWKWMWSTFSFDTTAGFDQYEAPDSGQWGLEEWDTKSFTIYEKTTGVIDETRLHYVPWNKFRLSYYGEKTLGRPSVVSQTPNGVLVLRDVPDEPTGSGSQYTVNGERYTEAKQLVLDADEPDMPVEFHDIIVLRAARRGSGHLRDTARVQFLSSMIGDDPRFPGYGRMGDLMKSQWIDLDRQVWVP